MRGLGSLVVTCACALGLIGSAGAAPDASFGSGGEILFANHALTDVAIDAQGRIVTTGNEFGGAATIRRLLPDGSGDPTLGVGGVVRDPLGSVVAISGGGAVDGEGRILIAGHADGSRYVARYLPDGTRDPSFGIDGVARFGTSGTANELHVDHEDRPIVLDGAPVRLTRLTVDGELDSSFGADGVLTTDIASLGGFDVSDGGVITVVGSSTNGKGELRRYLPDGTADPSFGTDGSVTLSIGSSVQLWAVAAAPGGGLVIAGGSLVVTGGGGRPLVFSRYGVVARLTGAGSLDSSFGSNGIASVPTPSNLPGYFFDVAARSDGAVVAGGGWSDGLLASRLIAVLTAHGELDARFSDDGVLHEPLKPFARRVRLDTAGRLVVVGSDRAGGYVTRYLLPAADTTPPRIRVADVSADATGPEGASVAFDATAEDNGGPVQVSCTPASGSLFPIGDTDVTCSAADDAGNTATASLRVHVRGAAEQFEALESDTPLTSLLAKLNRIPRPIAHSRTTCRGLELYAQAAEKRGFAELAVRARRIAAVLAC